MVDARASLEQVCATGQQPPMLGGPHQQQEGLQLLQGHARELQCAQGETRQGVSSLYVDDEYTSASAEPQVCPTDEQLDDNHVYYAGRASSFRLSESSKTENTSRVDDIATEDLGYLARPEASICAQKILDGEPNRRPFGQTTSGGPQLPSSQDSNLRNSKGFGEVQGLCVCTNCGTQQHNGIPVVQDQYTNSRSLDRSAEISCKFKNVNGGHSCSDRKSGQSNSSEGSTGRRGTLQACISHLFGRARRSLPSQNCRTSPSCTLEHLRTRSTLQRQQSALESRHIRSNTPYHESSLPSPEDEQQKVRLGHQASIGKQQDAQCKRRGKQSQQVFRRKTTSHLCNAVTTPCQPRIRLKRDSGAWWRTADAGLLTETNSLSCTIEDTSDAVLLRRSLCSPHIEPKESRGTATIAALGGSYPNFFRERFQEGASSSRTVGGHEIAGRTGSRGDPTAPVTSGGKSRESHRNEEASPMSLRGGRATSRSLSARVFPHPLFRGLSLSRQTATTRQGRRGFARIASELRNGRGRVASNKASRTGIATVDFTSTAAASHSTPCGLYYNGRDVLAGTNFQSLPKPVVDTTGSTCFERRSLMNICPGAPPSGSNKTIEAMETRVRAAGAASILAPEVAKTEEVRVGETSWQRGEGLMQSGGESWKRGRSSVHVEKRQVCEEIGKEPKKTVSAGLGEQAESDSRTGRKAPEHSSMQRLFQTKSLKRTHVRLFSYGSSRGTKVAQETEELEALHTKKVTPEGEGGTASARAEDPAEGNIVGSEEGTVSPGEGSGPTLRSRAAALLSSFRSSSFREIATAMGRGANESGRRSGGATGKEAEKGQRAEGDGAVIEASLEEGEEVRRRRGRRKKHEANTCGQSQTLVSPEYASYLHWHEEKWNEKVFDQMEVADIELFNHPLRRGQGCVIM